MKNIELEKLLSVNNVMEHFGISRSTLYHLTKTELPYVKIRNRKYFRPDDINNLIQQNYLTP
jgi:predicted DNA-binding transcriptional regulator AlpA